MIKIMPKISAVKILGQLLINDNVRDFSPLHSICVCQCCLKSGYRKISGKRSDRNVYNYFIKNWHIGKLYISFNEKF